MTPIEALPEGLMPALQDEQGRNDQDSTEQNRGQAFPEQQRIALHERLCRGVDKFLVGMTKVENKLRQFVITMIRIGMCGLFQCAVDPCRNVAIVVQGG